MDFFFTCRPLRTKKSQRPCPSLSHPLALPAPSNFGLVDPSRLSALGPGCRPRTLGCRPWVWVVSLASGLSTVGLGSSLSALLCVSWFTVPDCRLLECRPLERGPSECTPLHCRPSECRPQRVDPENADPRCVDFQSVDHSQSGRTICELYP